MTRKRRLALARRRLVAVERAIAALELMRELWRARCMEPAEPAQRGEAA